MNGERVRVAIVDDHPLVRKGICSVIGSTTDFEVCGETDSSRGALALVIRARPDVLIVDLSLGADDGLQLLKTLAARHPEVRILVVSMHDELMFAASSLRAGATGYLMKDRAPAELVEALTRVASGRTYVSDQAAEHILASLSGRHRPQAPARGIDDLSDRERHILLLLRDGRASGDIARDLGVSVRTVESHCAHIKGKLGLRNARELVRFAVAIHA